ncbi:LysE family translocator [Tritonibacter horizontis]|uniref:Homoserine/homoserine lactone efflux protein n=1 Tax=Tritonibacter horizontis TaxID=1768241 RepID=A0A132BV99_9RHOB|nr:LysE family translocator [Tritonibacter horizontis]KUP91660.1 homoserine/homoserine lactone efflux protein [Tritonibacter horizontis]
MIAISTLVAFVPAALALNITPGADMMFCLGQGLKSGPRSAIAASLGVAFGGMAHVALAGLGVAAAVAALPGLFDVIRWVGVGYLLYLAWGAIRDPGAADAPGAVVPAARAFRAGLMVSLTNPKVILFVLAFVPQFLRPEAGSVLGQFLVFGAIIGLGGVLVNGGIGVFAGRARAVFAGGHRAGRWMRRLTAGIFAGLALRLALLERA